MHTPGPWTIDTDHSPARLIGRRSDGDVLGLVYLTELTTRKRDEQHMANARLIATAPDLLAALKRALFILESPAFPVALTNGGGALDAIRAAIAKAEGAQ